MTVIGDDLFNALCTILTRTKTQNTTTFEVEETWANAEMTVDREPIGTGDGTTKIFYTLYKNVTEITTIYVNDVLQTVTTHYAVTQLNDTGNYAKITFVTAPTLGYVISSGYKHKDSDTIPCRLDVARGGVQVTNKDFLSSRNHVIFMDYRTDIDWADKRIKVLKDAAYQTFDVILPADAGGEQDHLEIQVNLTE